MDGTGADRSPSTAAYRTVTTALSPAGLAPYPSAHGQALTGNNRAVKEHVVLRVHADASRPLDVLWPMPGGGTRWTSQMTVARTTGGTASSDLSARSRSRRHPLNHPPIDEQVDT